MKKISLDIESLFNKPEVIDLGYRKLRVDKSSKIKTLLIDLKNKSYAENAILIECYDYSIKSEKNGDVDKLLISIDSKEFRNWINNKAFN
jgi:FAD synthase